MLNKHALSDPNLSLRARGLWATCLAKPDDWKFSVRHLESELKEGREAILNTIKELITYGYAMRLEHRLKEKNGKMSGVLLEYVFFEFPATHLDKINQELIFNQNLIALGYSKKEYHETAFPTTGSPITGSSQETLTEKNHEPHTYTLNKEYTNISYISPTPLAEQPTPTASAYAAIAAREREEPPDKPKIKKTFSPAVKSLADKLIKIMQDACPTYRKPYSMPKFLAGIAELLEVQRQDEEIIIKTWTYAAKDDKKRGDDFPGWSSIMCGKYDIKNFVGHFVKLTKEMKSQKARKFAPCSDQEEALAAIKQMHETAL